VDYDAIEKSDGEWYELHPAVSRQVGSPAVREWRLESLIRAGFPFWQAEAMAANGDVDLAYVVGLVGRGCPVETAWRIVGIDAHEPTVELELRAA
jgi:hypothetical protein